MCKIRIKIIYTFSFLFILIYNKIGDNMIPICEEKHVERLKQNNIKIIEKYKATDNSKEIYTRSIIDKHVDEINNCFRLEKLFYHNDQLLYKENKYSNTIRYSYLDHSKDNKEIECPSCGYVAPAKDFTLGCPYCSTDFTIDYGRKSNKVTTKNYVGNAVPAILGTASFLTIFAMIYLFQTVNIILVILAMFLFLTATVLLMINAQYNREVESEDLWFEFKGLSMKINENRVFNDLYLQLGDIYYDEKNKGFNTLVDFEIIRYNSAEHDQDEKGMNILLDYDIRKFFFDGKTIYKTETTEKVKLYRNQKVRHKKNKIYASRCKNCGSTLDKNKDECPYCGSKNNSTMSWVIDKFLETKQKKKEDY